MYNAHFDIPALVAKQPETKKLQMHFRIIVCTRLITVNQYRMV